MIIQGEARSGIWAIRFSAHREGDTWCVEVRDSYQRLVQGQTTAASPWTQLDKMISSAFDGCRARMPERPPRPPLKIRVETNPKANKPLRLGPRRIEPTTQQETTHE
jgi:hypothetical protein